MLEEEHVRGRTAEQLANVLEIIASTTSSESIVSSQLWSVVEGSM